MGVHITVEIFMDESRGAGFSGENVVKHLERMSTDIENQCLRSLEICEPRPSYACECYSYPETGLRL